MATKTCLYFPPVPSHEFSESSYAGFEEDDQLTALVVRRGDVTMASSVRCYTRQRSAEAGTDFEERPDTDVSRLQFAPGRYQGEKPFSRECASFLSSVFYGMRGRDARDLG